MYSALLDMIPLTSRHKADLLKRGHTEQSIQEYRFASVPQVGLRTIPRKLISMGLNLDGVPGFYKDNDEWKMDMPGSGYFIPYYDEEARIQGLQIRYDIVIPKDAPAKRVKELKSLRYRWYTSSKHDNGAAASNVPYYNLPKYRSSCCYLTEGGLKAATSSTLSGGWFAAIPGVTCYDTWETLLENLKKMGVTKFVFDHRTKHHFSHHDPQLWNGVGKGAQISISVCQRGRKNQGT